MKRKKDVKKEVVEMKQDPTKVEWKDAFIVNAELGAAIIGALEELPIKYSKQIIPLLQNLNKSPRTNVTVEVPPLSAKEGEK